MPTSNIRVRFAPAPTGFLHVGGARTALFNWLFARHHDGEFLLRIEDTDTERNREEWVEGIQNSLRWLGLDWDLGPVRQSSRLEDYAAASRELLASGHAYWCDCTPESVACRAQKGRPPGYDGYCRDRGLSEANGHVVRFRVPSVGEIVIDDLIRGEVVFENRVLEDFVIQRSSGATTFYLANALDDVEMDITHVIRGEDLLSSTPRTILLRKALGRDAEIAYGHLPLLVGADRQKLSKRHGDVALEDYQRRGYLPQAMVNYLSLLGWAPGDDREILSIAEIVDSFDLNAVTKSPAFFDVAKLDHLNGHYIRELSEDEFLSEVGPYVQTAASADGTEFDPEVFAKVAGLVQARISRFDEAWPMVDFLFSKAVVYDEDSWVKAMQAPAAREILSAALSAYRDCHWSAEVLHQETLALGEPLALKLGKTQAPIRVAVTGKRVGPPLFESLEVLGREVVLSRIEAALRRLG